MPVDSPSTRPPKVMCVLGTRPEAIKMAPVVLRLPEVGLEPIVVATGQHREMLDQVLQTFSIEADENLSVGRPGQTLAEITARALEGLDGAVQKHRPDAVVVQGDTTTTLSGALAAFYHHVPVAHMEAGLRTGNVLSPFPEEVNRRITTRLASLHLAPTRSNVANLVAEGVPEASIVCTGNTVIDALRLATSMHTPLRDPRLAGLDADPRRVVLVTVHRREAWGPGLDGVGRALCRLAADPGLLVVAPLHLNPLVRRSIEPTVRDLENMIVCDPLPYGEMSHLMSRADLVLTDSGGIQEEAPSLGKPVLVLRDTTERPEAVEAGTVEVVGTDEEIIVARARAVLDDHITYARMARTVNPYGDGEAARRTVEALRWFLGTGSRPVDWEPPRLDRPADHAA